MKKLFILLAVLYTLPSFAACPLDIMGGACSIASDNVNFQDGNLGTENNVPLQGTGLPALTQSPKRTFVAPTKVERKSQETNFQSDDELRTFRQTAGDYSYNSNCQFGVCRQTGTPRLFQQR